MVIETISKAYQAENLIGSYCTAPLRAYNTYFQNKIQASESACERIAWTIFYVVSGIFTYLTLGVLALVGIAINLCLIPPENGYSLWARLNGVPGSTEKFCEKIRSELSLACRIRGNGFSGSASLSSDRLYTYNLKQNLSFDIQDIFKDVPLPLIQAEGPVIEKAEDQSVAIRLSQNEDPSQAPLSPMESKIVYIQNIIRTLSQQHSWYPEKQWIKTVNDRTTLIIPLPDHIPIHNLQTARLLIKNFAFRSQ
jgi:hypothetical protein